MKRLIALATAALAVLALGATPATAGSSGSDVCVGWETAGAGNFDSVASLDRDIEDGPRRRSRSRAEAERAL